MSGDWTDGAGQPTVLYRLYDCNDVLLYIGITNNLNRRLAQHAEDKTWWPQVDRNRTRVSFYDTRDAAEAAELVAIRDEEPKYNLVTADADGNRRLMPGARPGGRPPFVTPSAEQTAAIELAALAARNAAAWDKATWAAIDAAKDMGVPVDYLCRVTGRSAATYYRRRKGLDLGEAA